MMMIAVTVLMDTNGMVLIVPLTVGMLIILMGGITIHMIANVMNTTNGIMEIKNVCSSVKK
jgi:hypothetical protein